jgi:hypothetical protein
MMASLRDFRPGELDEHILPGSGGDRDIEGESSSRRGGGDRRVLGSYPYRCSSVPMEVSRSRHGKRQRSSKHQTSDMLVYAPS